MRTVLNGNNQFFFWSGVRNARDFYSHSSKIYCHVYIMKNTVYLYPFGRIFALDGSGARRGVSKLHDEYLPRIAESIARNIWQSRTATKYAEFIALQNRCGDVQ